MMLSTITKFSKYGLQSIAANPNIGIASVLINQISNLHTIQLAKGIQLHPKEKNVKREGTLQVSPAACPDRPLLLLYAWMLAKDRHIYKYADFYNSLGFDVLSVRVTPFDLLGPVKGTHVVNASVMEFLHKNYTTSPLLIHGFSVGAYAFCELVVKMIDDMESHKKIHSRFTGQIWDSPVDVNGVPLGLSKAVTKNSVVQKILEKNLHWFMKINYESATKYYMRASKIMHQNAINVPGLLIYSKGDPVSPPEMNKIASATWKEVYYKCFENSPHVGHYRKHQSDYEAEVLSFLERIHLINESKLTEKRAVVS